MEIKETGGARIGMSKATWPFATLTVNEDILTLNATIIGNLIFKPSDVISIELYSVFAAFEQGVRIYHRVDTYNEKVIFFSTKSPKELIRKIEEIGFLDNKKPISPEKEIEISKKQLSGGFPLQRWFTIAMVSIWQLLLLYDLTIGTREEGHPMGYGSKIAIGLVFLSAVLLVKSESFRQLILKKGRTLDDIKVFVYFLLFLSGIMFFLFTLLF